MSSVKEIIRQVVSPPVDGLAKLYGRFTPLDAGDDWVARVAFRCRPAGMVHTVARTSNGYLMDLDLNRWSERMWTYGLYERCISRWMRKLLRKGDQFIDAGANHGYFTLLAARLVGPTGRVDSFEPVPTTFARLKQNVDYNGHPAHVHLHQLALSNQDGEVPIYANPENDGRSSLAIQEADKSKPIMVRTVRMDDQLKDANPRMIKMDVEGAEPLAIAGMSRILESAPTFIVEYSPTNARPFGFEARTLVDRLLTAQPRYKIYHMGPRLRRIEPTDADLATVSQHENDSLMFSVDSLAG